MENKNFGKKLKDIRKELPLTQMEAADLAFISRRKLIDIENGKTIPSIEDIISLSNVYKKNLTELFVAYNKFHDINIKHEIDEVELKLSDMDYDSLKINITKLNEYKNINTFLKQYYHAIVGFYHMKSENMNIEIAMNNLLKALTINNENFDINSYKKYKYSSLELRVLIALADCIRFNGDRFFYYNVCEFCFNQLSEINISYLVVTIQFATIKSMQKEYQKSIDVVNNGIKISNHSNNHIYLPFLYYLNHINYKILGEEDISKVCLNKAITLCDCYNKVNLKKLIIDRSKEEE